MAKLPTLLDEKDHEEIFLDDQKKTTNSLRHHYFNVKLFLGLVFVVTFLLTSNYLWDRFNHTKLALIVKLDVGKIQGLVLTQSGIEAEYFLGIPFAEPPIEENRFEKTVPVKPWSGTKLTIKTQKHCAPLDALGGSKYYSEDCLYLNIVRPTKKSNELLPVLLSVHGGAFEMGGASLYGLSDTRGLSLLKHGVITVAIQYRLAVFGFASTGDKELPGNLGYFDQAEALSFVHRNIRAFGGDPDQITIIGCSAGGASVTALSISPYTRDYVHQAIAQSGSAFSAWATSDYVVENTQNLVKVLGLKENESIKQRLKRATTDEIYRAVKTIGTTHFGENFGVFMPRIDGDFFPKDLPDLIQESPQKSIVIGLTSEESLAWTLVPSQNTSTGELVIPDEKMPNFSLNDLKGLIFDHLVLEKFFKNETRNVQDQVLDFYSTDNSVLNEKDNVFYLQKYTQILSDLQFNIPVLWEILLRGAHGWKVFAYKSSYINDDLIPKRCLVKESYHGTDQHYANMIIGDSINDNDNDFKMERLTIKWLINFVKTGNPSSDEFEWLPTTKLTPLRYANFLPCPQLKDALMMDRAKFWTKLAQEHNYDLVRMMSKKHGGIDFAE